MSKSPYDTSKITPNLYGERSPVEGKVVAILHISFTDRHLKLIEAKSRALLKHEIHEIMITDERKAAPGGSADSGAALCFFEVVKGGLIVAGDSVTVAGHKIGDLVGYDENHMPNHLGVILFTQTLDEPTIVVGDKIAFKRT